MINEFKKKSIKISSVKFCPHLPNSNCLCRKPKIKMFEDIDSEFLIDKENSWLIGDKESDLQFALNCGIKNTIFMSNSKYQINSLNPDFIIENLNSIKRII